MKAPVPYENEVSVGHFLKFAFIYFNLIFEIYYQKPILLIFIPKLKGLKLSKM